MTNTDDARARNEALSSVPGTPDTVRRVRIRAGLARYLAGEAAHASKAAKAEKRPRRDKGTPGTPTPHGAG